MTKFWIIAAIGATLAACAFVYFSYGAFAESVVDDVKNRPELPESITVPIDTCYYSLRIPPNIDHPNTPFFDTTIVRSPSCNKHWLQFPAQGTSTTSKLQKDTVVREIGFYIHDESQSEWLDISQLPQGEYNVTLIACGNGGSFKLRIED